MGKGGHKSQRKKHATHPVRKKTRIRKHVKKKEIEIISRRTQPRWKTVQTVEALEKKISFEGQVSSSWIAALAWDADRKEALMYLKDGKLYIAKIPFSLKPAGFGMISEDKIITDYTLTRVDVDVDTTPKNPKTTINVTQDALQTEQPDIDAFDKAKRALLIEG